MDEGFRAIITSNQVGLKNLVLSHARKWHRATLSPDSEFGQQNERKIENKNNIRFLADEQGYSLRHYPGRGGYSLDCCPCTSAGYLALSYSGRIS